MIINSLRKILFVATIVVFTDNSNVVRLQALSTMGVNDNTTVANSFYNNILGKSTLSDKNLAKTEPKKGSFEELVNLCKAEEQARTSESSDETISEKSQKDEVAFYQTDTFKYALIGTAVTAAALTGVYIYDPTILTAAGAALWGYKDDVIDFSKEAIKWTVGLIGIRSAGSLLAKGVKASKDVAKSTNSLLTKSLNKSQKNIVTPLVKAGKQSMKNFKHEKHHLFNVFRGNPKYSNYFKDLGIEVDNYCVRISKAKHEALSPSCTRKWKDWIDNNPIPSNATEKQKLRNRTINFAKKMAKDNGLSWENIEPYK